MTSPSPLTCVLTLAPRVFRATTGLIGPSGATQLTDQALIDALCAGASLEHLLKVGTPRAGRDVRGVLEVLMARRLLAWQLRDGAGEVHATMWPIRDGVGLVVPRSDGVSLSLSRFALLRRCDGDWLLESGRSPWQVALSSAGAVQVTSGVGSFELHALLQSGGLLHDSDDDGSSRYWEFHDRYFASRSRRDLNPSGATSRFAGTHEPIGAQEEPPHDGRSVSLPVPEAGDPGPGLWAVTERRRSPRSVGKAKVPLALLGSLLWHTLRVTDERPRELSSPTSFDVMLRPVPSGGGTHSTGLWLWCHDVEGVEPGVWWYDPWAHALRHVGDGEGVAFHDEAAVHGVLVSRHGRIAWRYERIAHAVALKDSGVILHAMQLAATALDLTLCPIGSGPTDSVLKALGLDEDSYIPVGEFWMAGGTTASR